MIVLRKIILLLALIAFLGIAPGMPSEDGDKPVIRLAYSRVIDDLPFYVGVEEGLFEKEGVRVELLRLIGATNNLAAVIRNDLQAGIISSAQVFPAAQQALPIKVVAWLGKTHKGTHCGLHVRKGGDVHSIRDLRGKKIALSNDNMNRTIVSEALAQKGMTIRDVELVLGIGSDDPMQHEAVLKSGRVDVIIA
jgi:ABC-type nitrate/sulfonate/bicarbonate transport system substrate-binding protein